MALPSLLESRLALPLIVAPMFQISNPAMVIAACNAGVIGSFPAANCGTPDELDAWLTQIQSGLNAGAAPFAVNLIVASSRLADDLEAVIRHRVKIVITSVGSPRPVIEPLQEIGALVLADVATMQHARKAVDSGVDGLILLTAGAGGQTGWANGFAFVRAVREFYDGIIVLAGGLSDGVALRAAEVLGSDLGYMGTAFIATNESSAATDYKAMVVDSELDDVVLTKAFSGLQANMLRRSIIKAGLNPEALQEDISDGEAAAKLGKLADIFGRKPGDAGSSARRWRDIWSAGHSVSGIRETTGVAERIARIRRQYELAFSRA